MVYEDDSCSKTSTPQASIITISHGMAKEKAPRFSLLSKRVDQSEKPCYSRQLLQPPQQNKVQGTMNLSVSVYEFSASVIIPAAVLDAIWSKAGDILSDSMAMCTVPGGHQKDHIVKSSSSLTPM